jgi:TPP-dependent pyruvate/acetoin dehydrogenase alpha subunit
VVAVSFDSTRYRDPEEVKPRWELCPLKRMRAFLEKRSLWSERQEAEMTASIAAEIEAGVARYLAHPKPSVEGMFDFTYAALPAAYRGQREEASRFADA